MVTRQNKATGKWFCRVSYKDQYGVYKQKSKHGFKTKKEAEAMEREIEEQLSWGLQIFESNVPFAEYFERWAETYKIPTVSASTERKYRYTIKLVKNYFGMTNLNQVTRSMYQGFISERGVGKGRDTVEKTHYYLSACFTSAMEDGLIRINPTSKAILKWDFEYDDEMIVLSQKESEILNDHLIDNVNVKNAMLYIALNTGLRIGEIYGLRWDDFKVKTLSVKRGYDYTTAFDFTPGKNKYIKRTISILPDVRDYYERYARLAKELQPEYMFLTQKHKPLVPHATLFKHLKKTCRDLEITECVINALRHTHCSLLINQEVGINYISKRLGHSSTVETQKTYSHMIEEYESRNEQKIDIFNKKK